MDLEKISGLPLKYEDGRLKSKTQSLVIPRPSARQINEARPYLMYFKSKSKRILYYMYRNVHFRKNRKLLKHYRLRYDITVIPPGFEGKEFEKTVGHIHSKVRKGNGLTFTEVYEVIYGEAMFVFQKMEDKKVTKVTVYHAKAGDKVIVPPNHAHFTINPSHKVLIMSNWMCTKARSRYDLIKRKHGADYYFIKDKNKTKIIKNPNYQQHPRMVMKRPREYKEFNLKKGLPMYLACIENPSKFDFLVNPQKYDWKGDK